MICVPKFRATLEDWTQPETVGGGKRPKFAELLECGAFTAAVSCVANTRANYAATTACFCPQPNNFFDLIISKICGGMSCVSDSSPE